MRLAVIGPCSASTSDLAATVLAPDLATVIAAWAGSFTVIRRSEAKVEILTDASGACPVYTTQTEEGRTVWGSSARALAALINAEVDPWWLATYLTDKHADLPGRSAWSGVGLVPPGHRLILTPDDMTLTRWWRPKLRSHAAGIQRLRNALLGGVHSRVVGLPASTDLAGVDSTTLTIIAAGVGPVTGITGYPKGAAGGGDLAYARALRIPGLTREYFVCAVDFLPTAKAGGFQPTGALVGAVLSRGFPLVPAS
ncbi:hypothetical protein GCM10022402_36750 [Salinactinospora qingdaonensis]|uniref:Uncharacterized protein n=1 Tax=Salinactinospora qingdaonensis TaxID=702744 RepID=A0ABP7G3H1_9ACTN